MSSHYETIVIGLGAAGTAAATTLARAGKRVLALEAESRVGGRVHSLEFGEGVVELGAEWIHGEDQNIVYEQAIKNKIKIVPQGVDLVTYRSDGTKPDDAIQNLINDLVEQQQCDEMEQALEPGPFGDYVASHIKRYIKEKNPILLEDTDFIEQLLEFMNLLINNHNASNNWNDVYTHEKYSPLDGYLYMSWHKYGFKKYFDILLNNHNKGRGWPTLDIKFNTEVTQIEIPQESTDRVVVTCKNGTSFTSNNVIITVSLGVLKERHKTLFKPNLPETKAKAIERISMGVMDKILLSFEEIWWPLDTAFFGFLWRGEDIRNVAEKDRWTTKIFAASRPMGSKNVLTLWTSGDIGKFVETLPEKIVQQKCWELLQKFMGADKPIPKPTGIVRSKWYSNPFTRGSYTFDSVYCADYPNARLDLAEPLTDSTGRPRVLFAGEATHETHFSTVHGAVETGIREAMRLLPGNSKI